MSISRNHCVSNYDGGFYQLETLSKFGKLALNKSVLKILYKQQQQIKFEDLWSFLNQYCQHFSKQIIYQQKKGWEEKACEILKRRDYPIYYFWFISEGV